MADYPRAEPVTPALNLQSWLDLTFLHWRYPREMVQQQVPKPLEVETFDGAAWVGIVPFVIKGLRAPWMPALPWISRFSETNCRTYVRAPDGSSGVWFFSLDAARAAAVAGARIGYGLPYAWSRMRVSRSGGVIGYESRRRWPDRLARTSIRIEEGRPIASGELEIFLTARFRLYSFIFGQLTYTRIEHPPWPLRSARVLALEQTVTTAAGLPDPQGAPLAHFAQRVDVRVAAPRRLRA